MTGKITYKYEGEDLYKSNIKQKVGKKGVQNFFLKILVLTLHIFISFFICLPIQFNIFFCIFIFQGSGVFNLQFFCILNILLLQTFEADVVRGV